MRIEYKSFVVSILLLAGFQTQQVFAQATPADDASDKPASKKSDDAPESIQKIDVTGKRDATNERRNSSAAKIIISREDIEQYGDSNLGDVMRRLPGVTQGGRPGRGGAVSMRGMGGGFTQILIDGERIAPGFSVEQITPDQVERIEILRSPTAATGARAIAGTINIILREPLKVLRNDIKAGVTEERGHFSPDFSLTSNNPFGENGTYTVNLSTGFKDQINDTDTHTQFVDGLSNVVNFEQRNIAHSETRSSNFFTSPRLQWRLGAGEQFSLQPFMYHNESRTLGEGTQQQLAGSSPQPFDTSHSEADNKLNVVRVTAMLNKKISDRTRAELRVGGGRTMINNNSALYEFNTNRDAVLVLTTDTEITDKSWNTSAKFTHNMGENSHSLVGSGELEGVNRTENSATLLNGAPQLVDFGSNLNVSTRRTALYVQDEWDPSEQWSAYLGLRWEQIETRSDAAGNPVRNVSRVLTPLAQSVWRFADPKRDQIRLALTQSYRAPTTQNLVARPSLNSLFPVPGANTAATPDRAGNPELKPELAVGVDLAFERYLKSSGVVSVNLFTRRITDLIRNVTSLETVSWANSQRFVSRPQNLGKAITSGIEFDAKFQLTELVEGAIPLNLRVNFSVFDSKVNAVPGPNNRIDQQPRGIANLGADYKFRDTPFSMGGTVAWTPAYETQLTDTQSQKLNTKRVMDIYGLWNITPTNRLRLTLSNLAPLESVSTNSIRDGNQIQSVVSDGRTDLSATLKLELRL